MESLIQRHSDEIRREADLLTISEKCHKKRLLFGQEAFRNQNDFLMTDFFEITWPVA